MGQKAKGDKMAHAPLEQEDYKPKFSGEEMVLTFLFGVLLAGILGVLLIDYRTLTGQKVPCLLYTSPSPRDS